MDGFSKEEEIVAVPRTATIAVVPYVTIMAGVVTVFVVLDNNRLVTVMSAPENSRNLLRELKENGMSISPPFLWENVTSKVLYHPQENKSSIGLDGSFINLIPEANISMSKKETDTIKGKGQVDARILAIEYADSMRGKKDRNTVAVIVTLEGDIIYGFNREGVYNGKVQEDLDFNGRFNNFNRQCAEINAISKALNQGYDLTCATIAVVNVGGVNSAGHGLPKPPCNVCAGLISYYGMIYISF